MCACVDDGVYATTAEAEGGIQMVIIISLLLGRAADAGDRCLRLANNIYGQKASKCSASNVY